MIRDPLYRKIIARLQDYLDPELFEQCAADILRSVWPTLVPIRGGTDSGMDGAVADEKGEPFPLVSTTSENVIGNLTRNLKKYASEGGQRRKVILATSQGLSQRKRKNLEDRANELEFTLLQIYDQAALADRLYRNSRWCLELLDLTGEPPALSVLPRTMRPIIGDALIGRDNDLAWIRDTPGDRILIGQPGSGKTFLLYRFAKEGEGLFVVDDDRRSIANAIRDEQPQVIIVDDAHIHNDLLLSLRQIRDDLGASFAIMASSWPLGTETIRETLSLPDSQIHTLDPLTRDQIVEVINAAGISGPVELVRSIVDQAQGRPGLAVTLAYLCMRGDVRRVALGDALSSSVRTTFEPLVGKEATDVLAAFAMGGDSGMTMKTVAEGLGLTLVDVMKITTGLASGGVIREIGQDRLSVTPVELRYPLVRDVFYKGPTSLPPDYFLRNTSNLGHTVSTLIGAKARGAIIPSEELFELLEITRPQEAWVAYAWMGPAEAKTALERHPEMLIQLSRACLINIPKTVIPLLLRAAIGDERRLNSTTDHPFRLIEDWITSAWPGSRDVLLRRKTLLDAISNWLSEGDGASQVGLYALTFVFSPKFERVTADPGSGMAVTFTHGVVTPEELKGIAELWPKALEIIRENRDSNWPYILSIIKNIAYSGPDAARGPKEFYEIAKSIVVQMLKDVVPLSHGHPGILQKIKEIGENKSIEIEIPVDEYFEILFPEREREDLEAAWERHLAAVRNLAEEWVSKEPKFVVGLIAKAEAEVKISGGHWPRMTQNLCDLLAKGIKQRIPWIREIIDAGLPSDLIVPFLREAVRTNEAGWESFSIKCLDSHEYRYAPVVVFLTMPSPPADILDKVMHNLEGLDWLLETLCLREEVPEETRALLLRHDNASVASKAALGIWQATRGKDIESLGEAWRKAILLLNENDYWLGEILSKDSALAYEWLMTNLFNERPSYRNFYEVCNKAISALDVQGRKKILGILPEDFGHAEVVSSLVGSDLELYEELLEKKLQSYIHLVLLGWEHDKAWSKEWLEKAKRALNAGYSPEEVASATRGLMWSWSGKESEYWSEWFKRFEELCANDDPAIRQVGEAGKTLVKGFIDRALEVERREEIYGR